MEVIGKIQTISNTEQLKENFCKREFVVIIEHDQQFPQPIKFELHNDRCDMIDAYNEGQVVMVFFNLRGRVAVFFGDS